MAHQFPPPLDRAYPIANGRIVTRSLEAHIVDHCNLTCAECCSLSPLLPAWQVSPAELAADLAHARELLAPTTFKLVGGEPLLHPELVELVAVARRSGIAPRISITTNGLLLDRMPDALWDGIDALTISVYPRPALAPDAIATIEARAAQFGVTLNWKHQSEFVVMNRPAPTTDVAETRAIYDACWIRERCHMVRDGRFYTCTRPPHFQAYHRGAESIARSGSAGPRSSAEGGAESSIDFTDDGIALDGAHPDAVLAYLLREHPLQACAHCFGGNAAMVPHRLLTRDELVRLRR